MKGRDDEDDAVDGDGESTGSAGGDSAASGDESSAGSTGEGWPVVSTETTFECPWFSVGYDVVERPDGATEPYYWVDPWNAVSVVAETVAGEIVLVEQYRPRHGRSFRTLPKGGVDADESYEDAAARELREETGFVAGDCELVTTYRPSGWLRQERGVVYASDLQPGPQDLEAGEDVVVETVPVDEALALLDDDPVPAWTFVPLVAVERAGLLD